jgi:hypothetical protein
MPPINKKDTFKTTHRIHEHELLQRLERLCETAGLEFPQEAWPKDDHKAYFLLGYELQEGGSQKLREIKEGWAVLGYSESLIDEVMVALRRFARPAQRLASHY